MSSTTSIRYADRKAWKTSLWRTAVLGSHALARPTSALRALPDYLIVGAQRAGTTSLHRYMTQSRDVVPARLTKGVHWFDVEFGRGLDWYRAHFPLRSTLARQGDNTGGRAVTGEASPYYLFHPAVAGRIATQLPETTKILVVLRDPVARAWSHYHHEVGRGFETLPFAEALRAETDRLAGEERRLLAEPGYCSYEHQHHSYLARGRYAAQLERLFRAVGRDRVLVLENSELGRDPQQACDRVADFLQIPHWELTDSTSHNARRYRPMPAEAKARLVEAYRDDNEALFELLGRRWAWASSQ